MPQHPATLIQDSVRVAYYCSRAGTVGFVVPVALAIGLGSGTISISTAITILSQAPRVVSAVYVANFVMFRLYPMAKALFSSGQAITQERVDKFEYQEIYTDDTEEPFLLISNKQGSHS